LNIYQLYGIIYQILLQLDKLASFC
jgi:hypothetical protein